MSEEADLTGKIAIITGAGCGVGRAAAVRLAGYGVYSVLIGRREESLNETANLVVAAGARALVAPGDIGVEGDVERAVAHATAAFGGIDIAIHAAGVGLYGPVEQYSLEDWNQTLSTNLTGAFLLSRAVVPSMRIRGGGAIIAIASGAAKQGYPRLAAYAASKFGLLGFMQSLAAEVGDHGIKVSTILPGSIMTDFGPDTAADKEARQNGRKYLQPEDIADAIDFLLHQPARAWTQEMNVWPV
jgi:3-oxoacyl-[acyl-carrier protein] reductase